MTKILVAMAVGGGLFLAGCATVGARPAPAPRVVATFDEHGMSGAKVSLQRDDSSIKGSAYGRAVSLEWDATEVRGSYENLPVKLAVKTAGETVHVEGDFYGESATFQYAPRRIEGFLSGCAFLLERAGGSRFEGQRACAGRNAEQLTIAIPVQLARRSEAERAAWLALLLTDETADAPSIRTQAVASVNRLYRLQLTGRYH